jgi:predicted nucleic acid-binding Zn ribbon protein
MSGFCETLYPHRLERISDEYAYRFTVFLPYSELSPSEFIIVHSREIIMDERICMDELDTDEILEYDISRKSHELFVDDHRKDDSYTFSLPFDCISESFLELFFFL